MIDSMIHTSKVDKTSVSCRQSKNSPPFILLDPLIYSYSTTTFKVRITQTKVRSTQKYFPILKLCSILNFLIKYDSIQET